MKILGFILSAIGGVMFLHGLEQIHPSLDNVVSGLILLVCGFVWYTTEKKSTL